MSEELLFTRDLAVMLISAGIFTIISKALKQPSILGYIIAGFLIGPHVGFYFGISSQESVHQWAEIGIIFLMFGLGLEFSFKKLLKVGTTAIATSGTKFLTMFILGYFTGRAMSWTVMESIFLGGLLPMSSTTVILKSYSEMGYKKKPFAQIVFGALIVEDMLAILMMVLLTSLAVSNHFAGGELLFNLGKLAFFIALWFLVGVMLIPTLLKKAEKYLNDEILLIVSIGLCFVMVSLANSVGFSSALGAFVMGSILSETMQSERVEGLLNPIKDLFAAIFFVSVGMMIDPGVIVEYWKTILIIASLVLIADVFAVCTGVLVAGKGLNNAVHAGFSLAMLGEFGFIIAGMGTTLGVLNSSIYPIIIAVSVITTFAAPYMMKLADPVYALLKKMLPVKMLSVLDVERKAPRHRQEEGKVKKAIRKLLFRIAFNMLFIIAILLISEFYLNDLLSTLVPSLTGRTLRILNLMITVLLFTPFAIGIVSAVFFRDNSVIINRFVQNFNEKDEMRRKMMPVRTTFDDTMEGYDVHIELLLMPQNSTYIGHRLRTIPIRKESGASIIKIRRGEETIVIPSGEVRLYPFDRILAVGTTEQLEKLKALFASSVSVSQEDESDSNFQVKVLTLEKDSFLTGKTLATSSLSDYQCLLVSVMRNGSFIANPRADFQFSEGDTVWVAGDKNKIPF